MAQPDVINGEKLLVLIGNGASPEVFAAPCMINLTRGLDFTADTNQDDVPDCDNPGAAAWKSTNVVTLGCEITGEGMLDATDVDTWFEWMNSAGTKHIKFKIDMVGSSIFSGSFVCSKFTITGERKKKATVSVNLVADGPVLRTAVT